MTLPDRISLNIKMRTFRVCCGTYQKYFSVAKYGTYALALTAALDFSDSYQLKFGVGDLNRTRLNSRSNIIGVSPLYDYRRSPLQIDWRAQWIDYSKEENGRGIVRSKDFRFPIHGKDALSLAESHRNKMVEENMTHLDDYNKREKL